MQELIVSKLQKWQSNLIDISRKNVLLNFRSSRSSSLQIVSGIDSLYSAMLKRKTVAVQDYFPFEEMAVGIMDDSYQVGRLSVTPIVRERLKEAICRVLKQHGYAIVSDIDRLEALLEDQCGDLTECNAILAAARQKLVPELLANNQVMDFERFQRMTNRFTEKAEIDKPLAEWALAMWCECIGKPFDLEAYQEAARDMSIQEAEEWIAQERQKLETKLNKIRQTANLVLKERGVSVLYVAVGFLRWFEPERKGVIWKSPLLLMPVELVRGTSGKPHQLRPLDDDIILNPILARKMQMSFEIEMPELPKDYEKRSLAELFTLFEPVFRRYPQWQLQQEAYLGIFQFTKLAMYNDFEQFASFMCEHPLIQQIAGLGDTQCVSTDKMPSIEKYDRINHTKESFQVLDADSSQQEAILAAKSGASFIMQGPPGTGKSQTIANIIAELLADGKSILFMSEKMAALEVVKSRMEKRKLGPFLLELHSNKVNKKQVIDDLGRIYHMEEQIEERPFGFTRLDDLKRHLTDYLDVLHQPVQPLAVTPYQVHGQLSGLSDIPDFRFPLPNVEQFNGFALEQLELFLQRLDQRKSLFLDKSKYLWKKTRIKNYSFEVESEITTNLPRLGKHLAQIDSRLQFIYEKLGIDWPSNVLHVKHVTGLYQLLQKAQDFLWSWFGQGDGPVLNESRIIHEQAFKLYKTYEEMRRSLLSRYRPEIFDSNIQAFEYSLISKYQEFLDSFSITREPLLESVFEKGKEFEAAVKEFGETLNRLTKSLNFASHRMGIPATKPSLELLDLVQMLYQHMLRMKITPLDIWFDENTLSEIIARLRKLRQISQDVLTDSAELERIYETGMMALDLSAFHERFATDYAAHFVDLQSVERIWGVDTTNLSHISDAKLLMESLQDALQVVMERLGLERLLCSMENVLLLINVCKRLYNVSCAPSPRWFDLHEKEALLGRLRLVRENSTQLINLMGRLHQRYDSQLSTIELTQILQRFQSEYAPLFANTNSLDKAWNESSEFMDKLRQSLSILGKLQEHHHFLHDMLGLEDQPFTIETMNRAADWLNRLTFVRAMPTATWFNPLKHEELYKQVHRARTVIEEQLRDQSVLFTKYEEGVLTLHFNEIQERLSTRYESILRFLRSDYRHDLKQIKYHRKETATIKYLELKQDVKLAARIQEKQGLIVQEQETLKEWLGPHYDGLETDWARLESSMDIFVQVSAELVESGISLQAVKQFYGSLPEKGLSLDMLNHLLRTRVAEIEALLASWSEHNQYFQGYLNREASLNQLSDQFEWLQKFDSQAKKYQEDLAQIMPFRLGKAPIRFAELVADLKLAIQVQEIETWLSENHENNKDWLGAHYRGMDTDWTSIGTSIDSLHDVCTTLADRGISLFGPQRLYVEDVSEAQLLTNFRIFLEQHADKIENCFQQVIEKITAFRDVLTCPQPMVDPKMELSVPHTWLATFMQCSERYRQDTELLHTYRVYKEHVTFEKVLEELSLAVRLKDNLTWIQKVEPESEEWFGPYYQGVKTDWEQLEESLLSIREMVAGLNQFKISVETIRVYLQGNYLMESDLVKNAWVDLRDSLEDLRQLTVLLQPDLACPNIFQEPKLSVQRLIDWSQQMRGALQEWNSIHARFATCSTSMEPLNYHRIMEDMETIKRIVGIERLLDKNRFEYERAFGQFFQHHDTDWESITRSIEWANQLQNFFCNHVPSELLYMMNNRGFIYEECMKQMEEVEMLWRGIKTERDFLKTVFPSTEPLYGGFLFEDAPLRSVIDQLNLWNTHVKSLGDWLELQVWLDEAADLQLSPMMNLLQGTEEVEYHQYSYRDLYLKRFYSLWLDRLYQTTPELSSFVMSRHEEHIKQFNSMDRMLAELNTSRLVNRLLSIKQDYVEHSMSLEERRTLERELQKARAHKSIRTLYNEIPRLLTVLKPCVMMSPLTVSEYIDPDRVQFDVVIFDEASQIRSEEAIGAILRGKQVIIAGDNKQLPPTSFFNSVAGGQQDGADTIDEEYESILDECSMFLQSLSLRWHYRSKHESLIAFSNHHLYDDGLYTFPSADNGNNYGVSFIHVPDAIYDRGRTRKNIREAERVVELVINHMRSTPERSLGVIAFSSAQEEAIRERLERVRQELPELDTLFDEDAPEAFFIKNLENVQGDERDTILFSIGYGRDKNGVISYNFGPLNKTGGERRLNVAITRARYEIKVVSGILDTELEDSKLNKRGVLLLKKYLGYARTQGGLQAMQRSDEWIEAKVQSIEEDVYNSLCAAGLKVERNVGYSDFRLDFAIVHPQDDTRYILGITCDGKSYRSGKTVRDRERLRFQVLEELGWQVHRIWSQSWAHNKQREIYAIQQLVEKATRALPMH